MKKLTLFFILLSMQLVVVAQNKAGIIYGKNHAFSLTAPDGWVLDNRSGISQGLHAVFYEQGQTWKSAATVMYANTASLEDNAHETIEQLMEFDFNNFRNNYPDVVITDARDIKIKSDVVAKVRHLWGKSYGNHEAMAFIDAGKTGVILVLSSRSKEDFEKSLGAFENLVKSYWFVSNQVIIDEK